jgi:phage-related protein
MLAMKPVKFLGTSRADLLSFPQGVRSQVGQALYLVQEGGEPEDFKPMTTVGAGVYEIRVRDQEGVFRVIYVAKFKEAVYVLHAFQKKTQQTALSDLALAGKRYRSIEELL